MELVKPEIGTIFWMSIVFLTLVFILGKFAWGPIMKSLKEREDTITDALKSAERAKEEMSKLQADNQKILAEARNERDLLLKEAREIKDKIIAEAKGQASVEAAKLIENAKTAIESEKLSAINQIKAQVAELSVEIAEKILSKELSDKKSYDEVIGKSLENMKLN
jgi:F-type H+-transporting ATPase subunit b